MLSVKGKNNEDGSFDWRDAIVDAAIIGGMTFFTSLGGLGFTGGVATREILAAGVAAATQFFTALAIKRGLRKSEG